MFTYCDFNKEKAQVWAFSVIVKTDGSFAALIQSVGRSVSGGGQGAGCARLSSPRSLSARPPTRGWHR